MKILPILLALKVAAGGVLGAWAYQKYGSTDDVATGAGAKEQSGTNATIGTDRTDRNDSADRTDSTEGSQKKGADSKQSGASSLDLQELPDMPAKNAGLADYSKVRTQLEIMRQEVQEKIVRLKLATDTYDLARKDSENKLRIIAEEKQLLEETLQKEKQVSKERIDEALAFIEKMEPRKAAPVLENMDRDLVIQLFKKLKPKTVTKFLETMNPAKATEYMEYYTKIRSGREFELLRDLKMCEATDIPEETGDSVKVNEAGGSKEASE